MAGEFSTNGVLIEQNLGTAYGVTVGARSGLMTVVAAAGDCYLLRNVGARPFKITMVRLRFATTTAFTSAQCLAFQFYKVYGCTAVHDTGSPISIQGHWRFQGNVPKTSTGGRVSLTELASDVPSVALSAVISDTAAITNGTYTSQDADEPEIYAVSAGSTAPAIYEDWQPRDGLPLVLEQNTGLLGEVGITMGTAGVGRLYVGVDGYFI